MPDVNEYFTKTGDAERGPFTFNQVKLLWEQGQLTKNDQWRVEGMGWRPLSELLSRLEPPPPPAPPPVAPPPLPPPPLPTAATSKLTKCPDCGREVSMRAAACPSCGCPISVPQAAAGIREEVRAASSRQIQFEAGRRSAFLAAILNLVCPGLGTIYCGTPILGLFSFMICVPILIFTAGMAYVIIGPLMIIEGVNSAGRANRNLATKLIRE